MLKIPIFCACLQFCLISWAYADTSYQSHQSIQQTAKDFLASNLRHQKPEYRIEVGKLDRRLKLPLCQTPLVANSVSGSQEIGSISVGVRCNGPKPWSVYIRAQIKLFKKVLVLTESVARGQIITTNMVSLKKKDVSTLRQGYITSINEAIDHEAKRHLTAGTIITPRHFSIRKLIKRGQRVTIQAKTSGLNIKMTGHALMDGIAGQRIRVRNDNSQRIVEGVVTAQGIVQVSI